MSTSKKKVTFYLPLIVLALLGGFLLRGLWLDPQKLPSVFINKPLPVFNLPTLAETTDLTASAELTGLVSNQNFMGKPWVLNVFASWCQACIQEHKYLMQLARKNSIMLVGLAYKDKPSDTKNWLKKHGNPYDLILVDQSGKAGIEFGVYGVPETFLMNQAGVVNYKHVGPIDNTFYDQKIKPLLQKEIG